MKARSFRPRQCERCGKWYTPTAGNQKYCPACGIEDRKAKRRESNRAYFASPKGKAKRREYNRAYFASPKGKAKRRAYDASPKGKAKNRAFRASPEGKAWRRAYKASPKGKAWRRAYNASPKIKARERERQRRRYANHALEKRALLEWAWEHNGAEGAQALLADLGDRSDSHECTENETRKEVPGDVDGPHDRAGNRSGEAA